MWPRFLAAADAAQAALRSCRDAASAEECRERVAVAVQAVRALADAAGYCAGLHTGDRLIARIRVERLADEILDARHGCAERWGWEVYEAVSSVERLDFGAEWLLATRLRGELYDARRADLDLIAWAGEAATAA